MSSFLPGRLPGAAIIETPVLALSKLGGPGAADVVIGSTDIPAVLLTASTQILSGRVPSTPNWNSQLDVVLSFGIALDAIQLNGDTLTMDLDYIFAASGVAAIADLNKPVTSLSPVLTATTAGGLIDETLYRLDVPLDRNDATNPYVGALSGGFAFEFNIAAASVITAINAIGVGVVFPGIS